MSVRIKFIKPIQDTEHSASWFEINSKDERDALISPSKNQKTKHICVIDNYTPWCGPCKMISNDFSKLANKYTSSDISETTIIFGKENAEKRIEGHPNLEGIPTFHFYVDGKYNEDLTVIGANINKVEENIHKILE